MILCNEAESDRSAHQGPSSFVSRVSVLGLPEKENLRNAADQLLEQRNLRYPMHKQQNPQCPVPTRCNFHRGGGYFHTLMDWCHTGHVMIGTIIISSTVNLLLLCSLLVH